jgi:putative redox protein
MLHLHEGPQGGHLDQPRTRRSPHRLLPLRLHRPRRSEGDFATPIHVKSRRPGGGGDFLRQNYQAPRILIGHSLGGTAVLVAARQIPETVAVATIAAPAGLGHMQEFLTRQAPGLGHEEVAEVEVAGRPIRIKGQLLDDLRKHDVLAEVAQLALPLLVFHSPTDEVVGIDHARRIFEAARHPKSFIALDGADHLLIAREQDARYVADLLAAWARRYLPRPA